MTRSFRGAPALLALLALLPITATDTHAATAHGGGGATVVLRYHFAPGQTLTYRLAYRGTLTTTGDLGDDASGRSPQTSQTAQGTELVRERVRAVDAGGVATLAVRTEKSVVTQTVGGRTTTTPLAALTFVVRIAPDGAVRSPVTGPAIAAAQLGLLLPVATLPSGPVTPGARWTTTSARRTVRTPTQTTTQSGAVTSTLLGYGPHDEAIVAAIASAARGEFTAAIRLGHGRVLHERGTTKSTARTLFDVAAGQVVTSTTLSTLTLEQHILDQPGPTRATRTRTILTRSTQQTSLQRV